MIARWLGTLGIMLGLATSSQAQLVQAHLAAPVTPAGYLVIPAEPTRHILPSSLSGSGEPSGNKRLDPYVPHPGDIVLFYDDFNPLFHFAFKIANTAPPTHTAIVIARDDGSTALLDLTGPRVITAKVVIIDVEPRLTNYQGEIMIRRIREPLTAEQSHELTAFANAQVGKGFAVGRVLMQATPLCPRSGLRRILFGKTYLNRDRWFCSEMVIAAGAAAKVIDPEANRANGIYPHDLAVDDHVNLSALYYPPATWVPANAPSAAATHILPVSKR